MNKLILVLFLAVCLVTAHAAIVKRDAPVDPAKPEFDLTKELDGIKQKIEETFNSEKMKETITKIGDQIKDGINKFLPTEKPKA